MKWFLTAPKSFQSREQGWKLAADLLSARRDRSVVGCRFGHFWMVCGRSGLCGCLGPALPTGYSVANSWDLPHLSTPLMNRCASQIFFVNIWSNRKCIRKFPYQLVALDLMVVYFASFEHVQFASICHLSLAYPSGAGSWQLIGYYFFDICRHKIVCFWMCLYNTWATSVGNINMWQPDQKRYKLLEYHFSFGNHLLWHVSQMHVLADGFLCSRWVPDRSCAGWHLQELQVASWTTTCYLFSMFIGMIATLTVYDIFQMV